MIKTGFRFPSLHKRMDISTKKRLIRETNKFCAGILPIYIWRYCKSLGYHGLLIERNPLVSNKICSPRTFYSKNHEIYKFYLYIQIRNLTFTNTFQ